LEENIDKNDLKNLDKKDEEIENEND